MRVMVCDVCDKHESGEVRWISVTIPGEMIGNYEGEFNADVCSIECMRQIGESEARQQYQDEYEDYEEEEEDVLHEPPRTISVPQTPRFRALTPEQSTEATGVRMKY